MLDRVKQLILDVPDFPKAGIVFKDITPLLGDAAAFGWVIDHLADRYKDAGLDAVVGMESRGFLFGTPLAIKLGLGFIPVRKPGKLPRAVHEVTYELEYGTDSLQIHKDALSPGQKVLIMDDVLATGGTAAATASLVRKTGSHIHELAFLMELAFLDGKSRLSGDSAFAILSY